MDSTNPVIHKWSNHESNLQNFFTHNQLYNAQQADVNPKRHVLHLCFIGYTFVSALVGFFLGMGQFFVLLGFSELNKEINIDQSIHYAVSIYLIVLCILCIINEMELGSFILASKVLEFWPTRGIFYTFLGLISMEQVQLISDDCTGWNCSLKNYNNVMAIIMMGSGVGYFLMGVCCLQFVYKKKKEGYKARKMVAREKMRELNNNPNMRLKSPDEFGSVPL